MIPGIAARLSGGSPVVLSVGAEYGGRLVGSPYCASLERWGRTLDKDNV